MRRSFLIALCLFVCSLPLAAGEISIPGKCENCAAPAPTATPTPTNTAIEPDETQISGTLIQFFIDLIY